MNIYYMANFILHYATENYVQHALEAHGATVWRRQIPGPLSLAETQADILAKGCNVVMFSKRRGGHFPELIAWCKANGILTVCWQWDLFWGYRKANLPQFAADVLLTTDGGHQGHWVKAGWGHHQVLRQGIHAPEATINPQPPKMGHGCDVAFVGSHRSYTARHRLVGWLRATYGDRFRLINNKRGLALNKTLANIRVVVGDSYPTHHYWSNRIYEITGRGGFLLHPYTVGLDEEYTEGVHYVGYDRHSRPDLQAKIDRYLADTPAREKIRKAGHAHTVANYTYGHRCKQLLQLMAEATGVYDAAH